MKGLFFAALTGTSIAAFWLSRRYRRDMNAARARLAAFERHVIVTSWGQVEYAEQGTGAPVLVVPGIYQHCISGLLSVRGLLPGRRLIAPSRFGYLGSSLPQNASVAGQADAFAALLDALGIDRIDVIAISAGAPSALQLALRHPERVRHLAVLVGNLPGSPTAVVQPPWARRIDRQLVMWALNAIAPSATARLVSAVPKTFVMTREHVRLVAEFIDSLFPMSPEGYNFDLYVSNADVNSYALEAIRVPTLIVHTQDDQLASHQASKRAAERIPGARFVSLESGGHMMLGQEKNLAGLATFLASGGDQYIWGGPNGSARPAISSSPGFHVNRPTGFGAFPA
jgi:pimeloyl-ACP methyl ester carboxylesterase